MLKSGGDFKLKIELSIIIPVYNIPEGLLRNSLESVIRTKNMYTEIIIVDDGSNGVVAGICDEYSDEMNDCFVIHQVNQGVSVARNRGLVEAKGEYIAFVDSDDIVNMQVLYDCSVHAAINRIDVLFYKYRRDAAFMSTASSDVVLDKKEYSDEDYKKLIYSVAIQKEEYEGYCIGSPWGKVFSKSFLVNHELLFLPNLRKMQDRVFMMYCLQEHPVIGFINTEGYCYINNDQSIVNKYNKNIGNYIKNVYHEIGIFNSKYQLFSEKKYNTIGCILLLEYLGLDALHKQNNQSVFIRTKCIRNYLRNTTFGNAIKKFDKAVLKQYDTNSLIKLTLLKINMPLVLVIISKYYSR